MNKSTIRFLSAFLATISMVPTVHADHGQHGRGYYRDYPPAQHRHHGYRGDWVGPAALLAITGLAIGAVAYNQSASAPVYAAPPKLAPPPDNGAWYYCNSSGQYYPYVRHCPEGWQAVMPVR